MDQCCEKLRAMSDTVSEENYKCLSLKKCTLCFDDVNVTECLEICNANCSYTQFGCIMHSVFKFSQTNFRTRYCCRPCSELVVQCFDNLLEINISAILTHRRTTNNTFTNALEEGCVKCASVSPSRDAFSKHYLMHFYESYQDLIAKIDNTHDMFDLAEDLHMNINPTKFSKRKPKLAVKQNKVKKTKNDERTALDQCLVMIKSISTDSAKVTDQNLTILNQPGDIKTEPSEDVNTDHCYFLGGSLKEIVKADIINNVDQDCSVPKKEPSEEAPHIKVEYVDASERERMMERRNVLVKKLVEKEISNKTNESRVCDLCGTVLNTKISLRNHMQRHKKHPDFPFARKKNPNKKIKRPRRIENLESSAILCPKCGKTFQQNFEMVTHMVIMHNAKRDECVKMQKRYRLWKCTLCPEQFGNCKFLQNHLDKEHNGVPSELKVRCDPCGRKYKSSKQLAQHVMLKHPDALPYVCYQCNKRYISKTNLIKHIASRHNEATNEETAQVSEENLVTEQVVDANTDVIVENYESYLIYMPEESDIDLNNYTFTTVNYD